MKLQPAVSTVAGSAIVLLACNLNSGGLGEGTAANTVGISSSTSDGPTMASATVGDNSGTMTGPGTATMTGPGTTTMTGMPDTTTGSTTTGSTTMNGTSSSTGSTGDTGGSSSSSSGGESSSSGGESSSSGGESSSSGGESSSSGGESSSSGGESSSSGGESSSSGGGSSGGTEDCTPIIAEALTALPGVDNMREWVVLYNPCMDPYDLTPLTLTHGDDAGIEDSVDLVGMMMPGDCFVIGGPMSDATNFNPVYDQMHPFSPTLDSGEGAILLHELPPAMIDIFDVPVDALIYGDNNMPGYLDTNGMAVAPMTGNPSNSESMRRTGLGPTWEVGSPPTPNACPMF